MNESAISTPHSALNRPDEGEAVCLTSIEIVYLPGEIETDQRSAAWTHSEHSHHHAPQRIHPSKRMKKE